MASFTDDVVNYLLDLQDRICAGLEEVDGEAKFREDAWQRDPLPSEQEALSRPGATLGGGGRTRVMEDGAVFEKAGVNFSHVRGWFSEEHARTMPGEGRAFEAAGVSLVLHPRNPWVPIVHMNVRRLSRGDYGWFGGGADLTPIYVDEDDARAFHRVYRDACRAHPDVANYEAMKAECDRYFYLPHRGEARGIGGIFYDYHDEKPQENFAFTRAVGDAFLESYLPIVRKHKDRSWGEREQQWQYLRRGRYVEFNLVLDRGTQFGLKTGGRTESILMSLPKFASWVYDHQVEDGSAEAATLAALQPRDWLAGE